MARQLTGRRLSSLPRTPVSGPLVSSREATAALMRAAAERAHESGNEQLQIKTASNDFDGLAPDMAGAPWRPFYAIDLPRRTDDLRFGNARNHARIRTVNRAERMKLRVREAAVEADLSAWYDVYLETMRWHAVPPRSYRLFKAMWDVLRPHGYMRLLVAELHERHERRLLAGSIFDVWRNLLYAFNGCRRRDLVLKPNDVIQWQAVHDACAAGFRYYALGEVPEHHHGLSFFKKKWGAEERWLYRYYYPAPQKFESGALHLNRTHRVLKIVWRRLPIAATRVLGECLYRYRRRSRYDNSHPSEARHLDVKYYCRCPRGPECHGEFSDICGRR